MTLTVVSAGLRVPSSTRLLADQLGEHVSRELAALHDSAIAIGTRHIEVRDHAHAIADALLTGFPTGELAAALSDVAAAQALIVVTPVFQASYSGLFKSFVDLIEPDQLRGMPVLLAATGGTERHSLVIEHALRPLFAHLGALPVPTGVYAATADFGGEQAPALAARITRATGELARLAAAAPGGSFVGSAPAGAGSAQPDGDGSPSGPIGFAASDEDLGVTPFAVLLAEAGQA
ncbi:MAG: CE1759 family FMN reductase [Tetrasphaera sp.]